MIEKLELKHIAPYLPYGLKFYDLLNDITHDIVGIIEDEIYAKERNGDCYSWYYKESDELPILRPLSDLTKEINYGLSTYAFTDLFEIGDCDGCIFEFEHGNIKTIESLEYIAKYNSYNDINYLPNAVVNMMIEYHFDIFGLIESNLAIDINTLDK